MVNQAVITTRALAGIGRAAAVAFARAGDRRAVVILASDQASFVTGQILTADGGKTAG